MSFISFVANHELTCNDYNPFIVFAFLQINPLKRQSPDLSGDSNSSPTGGSNSNNGVAGGAYMKSGPSAGAPANKKPKVQKKKKKRDPNEPQK